MRLTPYVDDVLAVVKQIPPGRVMSYGEVAEFVGAGGPRGVGAVMAHWSDDAPWWRVVRADGSLAPHLADRALAQLRAEGVPLRPDGQRVDMARARWAGPG